MVQDRVLIPLRVPSPLRKLLQSRQRCRQRDTFTERPAQPATLWAAVFGLWNRTASSRRAHLQTRFTHFPFDDFVASSRPRLPIGIHHDEDTADVVAAAIHVPEAVVIHTFACLSGSCERRGTWPPRSLLHRVRGMHAPMPKRFVIPDDCEEGVSSAGAISHNAILPAAGHGRFALLHLCRRLHRFSAICRCYSCCRDGIDRASAKSAYRFAKATGTCSHLCH